MVAFGAVLFTEASVTRSGQKGLIRRTRSDRLVSHVRVMKLDLTDEQAEALANELDAIVRNDRYPLSPRIVTLRTILNKLRPEPMREPLPPLRHYDPPRAKPGQRSGRR
jgi:hypothetical protein